MFSRSAVRACLACMALMASTSRSPVSPAMRPARDVDRCRVVVVHRGAQGGDLAGGHRAGIGVEVLEEEGLDRSRCR